MMDLRAIYGNKIFDRGTSYRNARYIPLVSDLLLDLVIAWAIIKVFNVSWDYAFIKVYAILQLYGILRYTSSSLIDFLNFRLVIKKAMDSEIRHYLSLFKKNVNWDEVGTYDDFLIEAAFNETLSAKLRVLAAINYATIASMMTLRPRLETRYYKVFCQIVPDYITSGE